MVMHGSHGPSMQGAGRRTGPMSTRRRRGRVIVTLVPGIVGSPAALPLLLAVPVDTVRDGRLSHTVARQEIDQ
jgi:hypothetical protein